MSLISVIVPVYNSEKYLFKCLESLRKQTFKDIEVVLVNDGSVDKSLDICKYFSKIDERFVVYNTQNMGVSHARNFGISKSNSQLINFVDSDDYVEENILEELNNALNNQKYDFSMCGYLKRKQFKTDNVEIEQFQCRKFKGKTKAFLENILKYYHPPILQGPCWKLFKKSIINDNKIEFNQNMEFGEDLDFVLSYLLHSSNISCINKCLYNYRLQGDQSLSTKFNINKMEVYIQLAEKLETLEIEKSIYKSGHKENIIVNCFMSYLSELLYFSLKNTIEYDSVVTIVRGYMYREEVSSCFKYLKQFNLKQFIFFLFFKYKRASILVYLFRIRIKIKCLLRGIE